MLILTPFVFAFRYDEEHSADDKVFLDCFCKIAAGIKNNSNGHQLKDLILQKGITQSALDYMKKHIPCAKKYEMSKYNTYIIYMHVFIYYKIFMYYNIIYYILCNKYNI